MKFLLKKLKDEKDTYDNIHKFKELKSLYILKLFIDEYKNDILEDQNMVVVLII